MTAVFDLVICYSLTQLLGYITCALDGSKITHIVLIVFYTLLIPIVKFDNVLILWEFYLLMGTSLEKQFCIKGFLFFSDTTYTYYFTINYYRSKTIRNFGRQITNI